MLQCVPNFDMENIHTVVNGKVLVQLLEQANYNRDEIDFIREGFTSGFEIGYEGPTDRQQKAQNLPLSRGTKTQLWNKMIKEVNLKQFAGPFTIIPYSTFLQSLVGLVDKQSQEVDKNFQEATGGVNTIQDTRLIFHLSWPEKNSLNYHAPKKNDQLSTRI